MALCSISLALMSSAIWLADDCKMVQGALKAPGHAGDGAEEPHLMIAFDMDMITARRTARPPAKLARCNPMGEKLPIDGKHPC